jgi:hypothetical protein
MRELPFTMGSSRPRIMPSRVPNRDQRRLSAPRHESFLVRQPPQADAASDALRHGEVPHDWLASAHRSERTSGREGLTTLLAYPTAIGRKCSTTENQVISRIIGDGPMALEIVRDPLLGGATNEP